MEHTTFLRAKALVLLAVVLVLTLAAGSTGRVDGHGIIAAIEERFATLLPSSYHDDHSGTMPEKEEERMDGEPYISANPELPNGAKLFARDREYTTNIGKSYTATAARRNLPTGYSRHRLRNRAHVTGIRGMAHSAKGEESSSNIERQLMMNRRNRRKKMNANADIVPALILAGGIAGGVVAGGVGGILLAPAFAMSTTPSPTTAPTLMPSLPSLTERAVRNARFEYGFFGDVRDPLANEVTALVEQTERFYADLFSAEYNFIRAENDGIFSSASLTNVETFFDAASERPVSIHFDLILVFNADQDTTPAVSEILSVMDSADLSDYLMSYVMEVEPDNVFFLASLVGFLIVATPSPVTVTPTPAPSSTLLPTVVGMGSTGPEPFPTLMPSVAGTGSRKIVGTRLGYGFFDGFTFQAPTKEEIEGLIFQTNLFFTAILTAEFGADFASYEISNVADIFDATTKYPVILDFDGNVVFNLSPATTPSSAEVFNILEKNADLQKYITDYVWKSEPDQISLFNSTQRVILGAKGTAFPTGPPVDLIVGSQLGYGFFAVPGVVIRAPTTEELFGLVIQTNLFFTDILTAQYGANFTSFVMENIEETFDPIGDYPVLLDFDANVIFNLDSSAAPTSAEVRTIMTSANLQDYIELYVWQSVPQGLFYDTERVSVGAKGQERR